MRNKDGSTWDSAVQHLFHSPCHLFDTYIAGKTAYQAVGAPRWLNRIFLWVMGFFLYTFYWFAACRMYYMLYSQVHTGLPSWTHPSSVRNVCPCRNRFTAVVQEVSRSALSLKGHPVHMREDTNTHTANINMCSKLSRCPTNNKDRGSTSSLVEGKFSSGSMSWPEQNNSSSTLNQQVFCVNREVKDIHRCLVAEINRQGSRCGGKWPLIF